MIVINATPQYRLNYTVMHQIKTKKSVCYTATHTAP